MGERKGMKGLELWCKKMTEGYPGVKIENMTTSWRDGLAFCAIIHHFRPDLIDFDKLHKEDIYHNNELAFRVAEHHLGIPALLEAEDMVEYEVPDRLSILTYLSQFYQTFEVARGKSGARIAPKRTQSSPDHGIVSPTSTSPPTKIAITNVGRVRREPCAKCGLPVFIAERLNVGKLLYHRTCFRCARCNSQLTLANYYETENGDFCCEICPDEEKRISKKISPEHSVLARSMSDEEKSDILQNNLDAPDAYSTYFETALEFPVSSFALSSAGTSEFTKARSHFFKSQMENPPSGSTSEEDVPPDLPKTTPPALQSDSLERKNVEDLSVYSDSGFPNNKHNNSSNSSDSVSKKTNDYFVTKDSTSSSGGLVRAKMKLFENNEDTKKSDLSTFPVNKQVPLDSPQKKSATVVNINDLEDFDNISKKDIQIDQDLESHRDTKHSISRETSFVAQNVMQVEDIKEVGKKDNVVNHIKCPISGETSFVNEIKMSFERIEEKKLNKDDNSSSPIKTAISRETSFVSLSKIQGGEKDISETVDQSRKDTDLLESNKKGDDLRKESIETSALSLNSSDSVINIPSSSSSVIGILDSNEESNSRSNVPILNDSVQIISDDSDLSTSNDASLQPENVGNSSSIIEILDATSDNLDLSTRKNASLQLENIASETDLKNQFLNEKESCTEDVPQKCSESVASLSSISIETSFVSKEKESPREDVQEMCSDSAASLPSMSIETSFLPLKEKESATEDVHEKCLEPASLPSIAIETSFVSGVNEKLDSHIGDTKKTENISQSPVAQSDSLDEKENVSLRVAESKYPENLNPFDEDGEQPEEEIKSTSLNPFGDEDEEEEARIKPCTPVPAARPKKKILPSPNDRELKGTPEALSRIYLQRISINPFDQDDKPEPVPRRIIHPNEKLSLNPFEISDDEEKIVPVPKPRTTRTSASVHHADLKPRDNLSPASRGSHGGSSSSISSGSAIGSARKKKPAPRPPIPFPKAGTDQTTGFNSLTSSPSPSVAQSPNLTTKHRKSRRAPPPPGYSSTPAGNRAKDRFSDAGLSPIATDNTDNKSLYTTPNDVNEDFKQEKIIKDEENRHRQSQSFGSANGPSSSENSSSVPNKSTYGKWKRRKGQAPARPIPERRIIKTLPMSEIRRELDTIEIQQQGLEKQGVRLEQIIRDKCEGDEASNSGDSLPIEVEDLILQLFELVNEKNELFRRQAELMYLRRQQRLEEEYADVEYQIRCIMMQPEANKTDSDKAREEALINRLVDIVERRNEIIECLEMDRVREAEEDDSINNQLNLYSLKRENEKESTKSEDEKKGKKEKKHKKEKKFKIHLHRHKEKGRKIDIDKDVDESETSTSTLEKKSKKKFNLF